MLLGIAALDAILLPLGAQSSAFLSRTYCTEVRMYVCMYVRKHGATRRTRLTASASGKEGDRPTTVVPPVRSDQWSGPAGD